MARSRDRSADSGECRNCSRRRAPTHERRGDAKEGPFGEWPGYFTEENVGETPVMVVKRVYYRNDPIMLGAPPLKPPASYLPIPLGAATLWEQLEKAGIPEVKGVWGFSRRPAWPVHRDRNQAALCRAPNKRCSSRGRSGGSLREKVCRGR